MIYHTEIINNKLLTIKTSELHDICLLKDSLRLEDKIEIWSAYNQSPERSLLVSYMTSSLCWTTILNDKPIMMFGCVSHPELKDHANVWMLGSAEIFDIKKTFVKQSKIYIAKMLEHYEVLYNWVDNRYKKTLKWLQMVGAEIHAPMKFGIEQELFNYFTIKKGI